MLARENLRKIEPYIPGKPIKEVERELGISGVIKLASNENPLGPSPKAIKAMKDALKECSLYPDGGGFYLREGLSKCLNVDIDNIILGNGSNEVMMMLTQAYVGEGDEVVSGNPAFLVYKIAVQISGGVNCFVELNDFRHDLAAMKKAVTNKTKVVFIANPNNPTGTMVSRDEVEEFMNGLPDDVIVVFDEAYFEYVERDDFPDSFKYLREGRNVLILRTFSKLYGLAGLRIGYGISNQDIIAAMNKVRQPFNTNHLAQVGSLAALSDEGHLEKSRKVNREGYNFLVENFKAMGVEYVPSAANFVLAKVKGMPGAEIYKKMLPLGVIVRPLDNYGLPEYFRVTIGRKKDNQKFIAGLKKVMEG